MAEENSDHSTPEEYPPKGDGTIGNPKVDQKVSVDDYKPKGTLTLALIYFLIVVLMWIFMYFGEFANHGPSIMN
ncbi:MAG TPA: hypothetical protein VJ964_07635 [Balneolaceae bacterium]|nr:hypothetical protein [Balneolaceae bacterium]